MQTGKWKSLSLALALLAACAQIAGAQGPGGPATSSSGGPSPLRADRTLLMDAVRLGPRLVAVGERGMVWSSNDRGATWSAHRTPTTRTLTALAFNKGGIGLAVGHGGTLLRSADGGDNWQLIDLTSFVGRDSLLGVTWLTESRVAAYGAFGLYLVSDDEGRTWKRKQVIEAEFDRHISRVESVGRRQLLVGESSVLALSDDGVQWKRVASPYQGSWFGALASPTGAVLLYGMRGHVYRSEDGGVTWVASGFVDERSVMGGCVLEDGRIVLVGTSGMVQVSGDDGRSFQPEGSVGGGGDLAQVLALGGNRLLMVGEQGARVASLGERRVSP
ncbi:WD40/YVTN/BNR-like repeat-containing protein [Methylibium sp.]|uniref:WD40/YVTN/BNR-like repeat-containing protein n=1 Tax=Methylibium sp. TaxID=2067992 RepID=UPI003D13FD07